ncbi:MAG TPA: ABC transporter permease [Candidatus Limnocylindrales bacterium]|nr:ABC transporter permease [Candidatus Limnocylindrales bacterium]
MDLIAQGIGEAFHRLLTLDPDVLDAAAASVAVSGTATLLSIATGIPLGALLGVATFRGRNLLLSLVNTGMGLPPVAVGLLVAIFVWRSGPLGALDWYCTRPAMITAQYLLAAPTVIGLTAIAIQSVDPMLRLQLQALGATSGQALLVLVRETRLLLLTAVMAAFGAVVSEVGASLMTGCNVKGDTRILTTAIVLETNQGHFGPAIALAIILMLLIFAVNAVTTAAQQRRAA